MDSVSAGDGGSAEGHAAVMEAVDNTTSLHDDSLTSLPSFASDHKDGGDSSHVAPTSEASTDVQIRDRSSSLGQSRPDLDNALADSPKMPQRSMSNPVAMHSAVLRSAERWAPLSPSHACSNVPCARPCGQTTSALVIPKTHSHLSCSSTR